MGIFNSQASCPPAVRVSGTHICTPLAISPGVREPLLMGALHIPDGAQKQEKRKGENKDWGKEKNKRPLSELITVAVRSVCRNKLYFYILAAIQK